MNNLIVNELIFSKIKSIYFEQKKNKSTCFVNLE